MSKMGMKQSIAQRLIEANFKEGQCIPSVRSLMGAFGASSATVQAALKILVAEGLVYCVHGKGNFWGKAPQKISLPVNRESSEDRLARLFKEDLEKGALNPRMELPTMKELSVRFQVSPPVLRKFIQQKILEGVLQRSGRGYSFVNRSVSPLHTKYAEILFVTRCNAFGGFAAESEREMDFLRFSYRRSGASRYKLILLGFDEKSGKLMDRSGRCYSLSDFRNAVGAIVSTLLVQSPVALLHLFSKVKYPVSVWWEHPEQELPKVFLKKDNWVVFNSSFGKTPGLELGRFLLQQGIDSVVYISPYHDSSWSRDRLAGLEHSGLLVYASVDDSWASPWDFKQMARQQVEKLAVDGRARELTKEILKKMVQSLPFEVRNSPWVCVNDEVAFALMECSEAGELQIPETIFAFDNSAESYMLRLPSYDFNTETLVEQMFYAIENPQHMMGRGALFQIRGTVVEK